MDVPERMLGGGLHLDFVLGSKSIHIFCFCSCTIVVGRAEDMLSLRKMHKSAHMYLWWSVTPSVLQRIMENYYIWNGEDDKFLEVDNDISREKDKLIIQRLVCWCCRRTYGHTCSNTIRYSGHIKCTNSVKPKS